MNRAKLTEILFFFKKWCLNPLRMGSLLPSSSALARFMAQAARTAWKEGDYILELGAGTGSFTHALIQSGIPEEFIISLELDTDLCHYLKNRFAKAKILQGNACFLKEILPAAYHESIGVILSGLPMLSFSQLVQDKILQGSLDVLKQNGIFLQFTYSPFSSIKEKRFGMEKRRLGWVMNNVPPATVWCYQREKDWNAKSASSSISFS